MQEFIYNNSSLFCFFVSIITSTVVIISLNIFIKHYFKTLSKKN